ncbi:MAG TPA: amylo-alpha-1,6-glucosidase [bacterium]|nr:amylo-alpha-1,6-glucosidase [bacterium]
MLRREWLVTNGLGGYASGTVAGANTRRYHGLLVAALAAPVGRTVLVAKVDETVEIDGRSIELGTNEYHDGAIAPEGYRHLAGFHLAGTLPVWTFALRGATLEKAIWMPRGRNATCVRYRLHRGSRPVRLAIRPYLTERDYHALTRGRPEWRFDVARLRGGIRVAPWPGATPYTLTTTAGAFVERPEWYWRFLHRVERDRGLDHVEDLYVPGVFEVPLEPGRDITLVASADPDGPPAEGPDGYEEERQRQQALVDRAGRLPPDPVPLPAGGGLPGRLVLAADQFLVSGATRRSVIAGYHWFADWGRDTMISLPGLTLATGRPDDAREILLSFAGAVSEGMLPNRFPDDGTAPEYTSADAGLWYAHAVGRYLSRVPDRELLEGVFPALREIVARYRAGTRHGIRVDPADGLLEAGAPGLALTWMDARYDGRAVTPRAGKAVDLNALWHEALCLMATWSDAVGLDGAGYAAEAAILRRTFSRRFFHEPGGYLYDVIAPDGTPDPSLRPNQLLALSLPHALLDGPAALRVLDAVTARLLTPFGLRSLAPNSAGYRGRYEGGVASRDEAYHQGTVWAWWLGPYVAALVRLTGDRAAGRRLLEPFRAHLLEAGLGTVSEIFDGDSPHTARGCIAQAWSVAALLEAWELVGGVP